MPTTNSELLQTFTDWARQVAAREDVPRNIRSAASNLHDLGKAALAAPLEPQAEAPAACPVCHAVWPCQHTHALGRSLIAGGFAVHAQASPLSVEPAK